MTAVEAAWPPSTRAELLASLTSLRPLSEAERARRWTAVRKLMDEQGVDGLLIFANPRALADHWLTNDISIMTTLVVPREGEPTAQWLEGHQVGSMSEAQPQGEAAWVRDWRFWNKPFKVVEVLREKELERARVGVVGAAAGPDRDLGWTPYTTWRYLVDHLPDATFVDVWRPFALLMAARSEEELRVFQRAASIAEAACQALLDALRPGASEAELSATVQREVLRLGGRNSAVLLHSSATGLPRTGAPAWQRRAEPVRGVQAGDTVTLSVFPSVGNIEAQAHLTAVLGEPSAELERCAEVAGASYERGLAATRAGATLGAVAEAMGEPLRAAGAWHLAPLVSSLNPPEWSGPGSSGITAVPGLERFAGLADVPARGPDLELRAGMTLVLAPNVGLNRARVLLGGNVIVRARGAQPLNRLPLRLQPLLQLQEAEGRGEGCKEE